MQDQPKESAGPVLADLDVLIELARGKGKT